MQATQKKKLSFSERRYQYPDYADPDDNFVFLVEPVFLYSAQPDVHWFV